MICSGNKFGEAKLFKKKLVVGFISCVFFLSAHFPAMAKIEFGFNLCPTSFVILGIQPNSYAEASGLRFGDQIKEINGKRIKSLDQVKKIGANASVGNEIVFLVSRGKEGLKTIQLIYANETTEKKGKEFAGLAEMKKKLNEEPKSSLPQKIYTGESPFAVKIQNVQVQIHFGSHILFAHEGYFLKQFPILVESEKKLALKNKYLKGENETIQFSFSSSNEDVLLVEDDGTVSAKGPGKATITVSDGKNAYDIPFEIILVPIRYEASQEDIIKAFGLPDYQKKIHVPWTKSQILDDIFYAPKPEEVNGIIVEHWKYNKYPKAVFRFLDGEQLKDITTPEIEKLNLMKIDFEFK